MSEHEDDGGPAFPGERTVPDGKAIMTLTGAQPTYRKVSYNGMSLRDHFAGQAVSGWLASFGPDEAAKAKQIAAFAYEIADAMLKERSK